jgi:Zn-dependent peptidase ImmA (M78 family)
MPQKEIDLAVWRFNGGQKLMNYDGYMAYRDRLSVKMMCDRFGVSKTALVIRLRQLGFLEDRPYSEYHDPLEILA